MSADAQRNHHGLRRPLSGSALVGVAALLVTVLTLLPIGVVVVRAADAGWATAVEALVRPRVGELIRHTLALVAITVPATAVLGVGAAWLVERTDLPLSRTWRALLLAPLTVPAFVNGYAWISLVPGLHGLLGAAIVTTLSYFPFVFLPVAAVIRGLDGGAEDSARALGLGAGATFARVVLPQLRPALSGGLLLVGLHLLAEYGVLEMMRYSTFTTAILEQYQLGFSNDTGSLFACVLIVLCLTFLGVEWLLRGNARVARYGRGTLRRPEPARLGAWTVPSLLALTSLIVLALGVPLASVGRWLVTGWSAIDWASVGRTGSATLGLALAAAALTTLAALPAAWLLVRRRTLLAMALERATYLASSLPGVVVALALVTLTVRTIQPLYQSAALLVLAYAILFIPRAMVSVRAGLAQAPPELSESARSLGLGPRATFRRVVLPLAGPGALAGAGLVFIAVSTELTATLILAPTGTRTLATQFWAASDELDYVAAAPFAAAMVLVSLPLTLALLRQINQEGDS
ncbi:MULTISPECIES: ABC transporter permease [unclassified Janibacter]|uniref:ABC transporter permease n=1 Tax=unclassified Janibacter TaxID=2649294 RepID=UPI003D012BAA